MLYVVATPIGNLDDITYRAVELLKKVDLILVEDTRHSKRLLNHYDIQTPLQAYHEHNETVQTPKVIELLNQGQSIALISDAGTPLISDPGYNLIREVAKAGLTVSPIPGACAAISGLCVSGLPTDKFTFAGFLPAKTKGRVDKLTELKALASTLIFYESPHRILASLKDIETVFPDTEVVLAKEITKQFERIVHGTASSILEFLHTDAKLTQGEFVLMIAPVTQDDSSMLNIDTDTLLNILADNLPKSKAAEIVAKFSTVNKRELYKRLL